MNGCLGCTTAIQERLAHMTRRLYRKLSESGQACNSGQKELRFWQDMVAGPVKEAIEMLGNDPVVVDGNSG